MTPEVFMDLLHIFAIVISYILLCIGCCTFRYLLFYRSCVRAKQLNKPICDCYMCKQKCELFKYYDVIKPEESNKKSTAEK